MAERRAGFALVAACAFGALGMTVAFADPPDGKALFEAKCALCHGKGGAPSAYYAKKGVRNLSSPDWQKSRTDAQIRKAILEGRPKSIMASFEGAFTPEEIEALVRHVRSLGLPSPATTP